MKRWSRARFERYASLKRFNKGPDWCGVDKSSVSAVGNPWLRTNSSRSLSKPSIVFGSSTAWTNAYDTDGWTLPEVTLNIFFRWWSAIRLTYCGAIINAWVERYPLLRANRAMKTMGQTSLSNTMGSVLRGCALHRANSGTKTIRSQLSRGIETPGFGWKKKWVSCNDFS